MSNIETKKIDLLCSRKEREMAWNPNRHENNNNVYSRYERNPNKHHQLQLIDIAAFCKHNDISPSMLRMAVRHIKEVAALIDNKELKEQNKIVVMTEEDYKTFELLKKMKNFQDKHK